MTAQHTSACDSRSEGAAADVAHAAESARKTPREPTADTPTSDAEVRSYVMAAFEASMIEYDELYKRLS